MRWKVRVQEGSASMITQSAATETLLHGHFTTTILTSHSSMNSNLPIDETRDSLNRPATCCLRKQ